MHTYVFDCLAGRISMTSRPVGSDITALFLCGYTLLHWIVIAGRQRTGFQTERRRLNHWVTHFQRPAQLVEKKNTCIARPLLIWNYLAIFKERRCSARWHFLGNSVLKCSKREFQIPVTNDGKTGRFIVYYYKTNMNHNLKHHNDCLV